VTALSLRPSYRWGRPTVGAVLPLGPSYVTALSLMPSYRQSRHVGRLLLVFDDTV
jgi:hypothetical protein